MSSVYCIRGGTVWEGNALKLFLWRADPDRSALIAAWFPPQGQLRHDALTALVAVAGLDHLLLADMARRSSDNAAVRSLPLLRLCTHAGRPRAIVHSIPSQHHTSMYIERVHPASASIIQSCSKLCTAVGLSCRQLMRSRLCCHPRLLSCVAASAARWMPAHWCQVRLACPGLWVGGLVPCLCCTLFEWRLKVWSLVGHEPFCQGQHCSWCW